MYAILDLLKSTELNPEQRKMAAVGLKERVRLYAQGCVKHGKDEEALRVREMAEPFLR